MGAEANSGAAAAAEQGIRVESYKQILFLPLRLKQEGAGADQSDISPGRTPAPAPAIAAQAEELARDDRWQSVRNPLAAHRLRPTDAPGFDRFSYQEFVYFHKFIQDELFPRLKEGDANETCRIFARRGLSAFKLKLSDTQEHTLRIERLWVYLFDIGVAVAMIELHDLPAPIEVAPDASDDVKAEAKQSAQQQRTVRTLDDALRVQNAIRRTYPPYFGIADLFGAGQPWDGSRGVCEYALSITLAGEGLESGPIETRPCQFEDKVFAGGVTPFAEHWQRLLAPVQVEGSMAKADGAAAPVLWDQTVDERLPSMTFISTPDVGRIGYPEWVRLGSMDNPSSGLPYGEAFLKEHFDRQHFYDRHWHAAPEQQSLEALLALPGQRRGRRYHKAGHSLGSGTRYLITGYGFVCVGGADAFLDKLIGNHFSRMYAGMGLLLHFQHATLLSLSGELSDLATDAPDLPDHQKRMIELQKRFNTFVQRYWFTNVSNQLQAKEMYEQWRAALGLDKLYREVLEQVKDAAAYLDTRLQQQQAEAALRLNQLAALGLPVAVGTALASIGMLFGDRFFGLEPGWWSPYARIAVLGVLYAASFASASWIYRQLVVDEAGSGAHRSETGRRQPVLRWLEIAALSTLLVGVLSGLLAWRTVEDKADKVVPSVMVAVPDIAVILRHEPLPLHMIVPAR